MYNSINPAMAAQQAKKQRTRERNQRMLDHLRQGYDYNAQAEAAKEKMLPDANRYISLAEQEFDRREAHAAQAQAQRKAAEDAEHAKSQAAAAAYRAAREAEQQAIEAAIEKNFIEEFTAAAHSSYRNGGN